MYFARRRGKEGEHLALCIHVPVDAIDRVKNITVSHSSNLLSHHRPCCKLQDKLCLLDLWELSWMSTLRMKTLGCLCACSCCALRYLSFHQYACCSLLDHKLVVLNRTKDLAETSEICSVSYDEDHILRLFAAFKQQSARVLLFLKNVVRLNFYVQSPSDPAPQLLYSATAKSNQVSQA